MLYARLRRISMHFSHGSGQMPKLLHIIHHIHGPLSRHWPSLAPWWHLSCPACVGSRQMLPSLRLLPPGTHLVRRQILGNLWAAPARGGRAFPRCGCCTANCRIAMLPGPWQVAGKGCNSGMITYDIEFQGNPRNWTVTATFLAQSQERAITVLLLEARQRSEHKWTMFNLAGCFPSFSVEIKDTKPKPNSTKHVVSKWRQVYIHHNGDKIW